MEVRGQEWMCWRGSIGLTQVCWSTTSLLLCVPLGRKKHTATQNRPKSPEEEKDGVHPERREKFHICLLPARDHHCPSPLMSQEDVGNNNVKKQHISYPPPPHPRLREVQAGSFDTAGRSGAEGHRLQPSGSCQNS